MEGEEVGVDKGALFEADGGGEGEADARLGGGELKCAGVLDGVGVAFREFEVAEVSYFDFNAVGEGVDDEVKDIVGDEGGARHGDAEAGVDGDGEGGSGEFF